MPIELKITAESPAELAFHVRSLNALFSPPMMVTADGDIVSADAVQTQEPAKPPRRQRGATAAEAGADNIPGVKEKGEPVTVVEGADFKSGSDAEVEVVGNDTLVVAEEPKTVSQNGVDVPALTYEDDIKPAILMLSMKKGREGVFRVLAQFGAEKSAKEIAEDQWPALLDAVETELAAA